MRPLTSPAAVFLFLFGLMAFSSCDQINKSFEDTLHPKPVKKKNTGETGSAQSTASSTTIITENYSGEAPVYRSLFSNADTLDQILDELKNLPQFKGKKLNLYQSMHFYDFHGGQININIQDPDTTENIDTYVYANGRWQAPQPVKVIGNISQVDFLLPLDKIRFATAKKVFDKTIEKSKEIPGAKQVQFVYFNYIKIKAFNKTDAKWYTTVDGSRNNVTLNFDVNGDLTEMKKQ